MLIGKFSSPNGASTSSRELLGRATTRSGRNERGDCARPSDITDCLGEKISSLGEKLSETSVNRFSSSVELRNFFDFVDFLDFPGCIHCTVIRTFWRSSA